VSCSVCGGNSDTVDPFETLSLELAHGAASLASLLAHFTRPEVLDGRDAYRCELKCGKALVRAEKRMLFQVLPPVLVIHLKRFDYRTKSSFGDYRPSWSMGGYGGSSLYDYGGGSWGSASSKISDHVQFHETLDVSAFISPRVLECRRCAPRHSVSPLWFMCCCCICRSDPLHTT
jgi:Ubiquitin carboxyl-terminal hydrolase